MKSAWRALLAFELEQQFREPLTALYGLVFFMLAFGYTSSGAVELVGARDGVAKTAPWALSLAFGGLTAFGQVITTMVAATAVLRDVSLRTMPLVATTGVSPATWFGARLTAASVVLAAVYAMMPLGAYIGDLVATVPTGGTAPRHLQAHAAAFATAYLVVTVPTCIVVVTLLSAAAAFSQRVMFVLATALALVGLWQLALALVAHDGTRTLGALIDPFANAPVLALTHGWSQAERSTRAIGLEGALLANRAIWLSLSGAVAAVSLRYVRWPAAPLRAAANAGTRTTTAGSGRDAAFERPIASAMEPTSNSESGRDSRVPRATTVATGRSAFTALTRFTASWILRDGGWLVVMSLALVNALANGWARASARTSSLDILMLVSEHARLFLILLATVYAGEVIWRERDVRIDAIADSTPIATNTMALGRLAGLFVAQLPLIALLGVGAGTLAMIKSASTHALAAPSLPAFVAWFVFVLWLPFAQLTALSVAVHAIVRHKVFAHLLIITGWLLAVVLDRHGAAAWWYRFAEPAAIQQGGEIAWRTLTLHSAWWTAISALLLLIAVRRWPRGRSH